MRLLCFTNFFIHGKLQVSNIIIIINIEHNFYGISENPRVIDIVHF